MAATERTEYLVSLLHELRQLPKETEWAEFKCNNAHPEEIGEYISALANAAAMAGKASAYIVWGVSDETHELVGTSFRPSQARKGNEELENWLLRLLSPRVHFRIFEFEAAGKPVSIIEVPRAVHQPVQFQGTEYIRVGSYKKKLKEYPEKERELWRIFDSTPFERQVAMERASAADVLGLLDYPSYFKLLEIPLPETRDGILARLASEQLIQPSSGGTWDITNLGAILFAARLADFRSVARKALRVVEYDGNSRVRTRRELVSPKGYAAGFEDLIGQLEGMLPSNEVIGVALRRTVPMYPDLATRELVANVIVHQDFTVTGAGPMIEVFEGRLEITNPGVPLMDTRRFLDSPPRSRNETLASFLRRVGICEERGSGIDKVVSETEFFQLPAPLFEVVEGHTRAVLFGHRPFAEMDKADRVRACYLHTCLQHVQRKQMTNTSLRGRFGIEEGNRAQVSRVVNDTIDAGLIKPYDPENSSRRHARYVPFWA